MATVFFSYSHKDEALRDQLETHLALLRNQGLIEAWHDRRIVAGDEFDDTILARIAAADIILLLVSSDFISSPYCYSREMMKAMERHDSGAARVIPVILRPCDWTSAPFGKLLAAPRDGKAVTSWPDRDEAFTDVAKQVRRAVEALGASPVQQRKGQDEIASAVSPLEPLTASGPTLPRSSNLRLKKEFSEKDLDDFLRSTFEYACRFFEGSIAAIGERNPGVVGIFERIDTRRMTSVLYRGGKKIAECSVRLDGLGSRGSGIAFSYDASANRGSFNEMLSVQADDQAMYLKSLGMSWGGGERDKHLSEEGAAEFLWDLFIQHAQR